MVGALPLVVWPLELAANGAGPGFRARPGKLPSIIAPFTCEHWTPPSGVATGLLIQPTKDKIIKIENIRNTITTMRILFY